MCTEKNRTLSQLGAEKITFPPKPERRTNISNYRVASLLKTDKIIKGVGNLCNKFQTFI